MAQVVVDSQVMRDKAKTIEQASTQIQNLYNDMLNEVTTTASGMKGQTIETEKQQFESMKGTFEQFAKDIKSYSDFLNQAADAYDTAETEGTNKAQEQGKIF